MSELQIFKSAEFGSVRTLVIDGTPYFLGKDVAAALGYTDVSHAVIDHVDEDDRINSKTQGQNVPEFGQRGTWLINESGVYALVFGSKLPSAKKFKHWVTSEVLPAVRKHGVYAIDEILESPDLAIAALTRLKEEREKRKELECLALAQRQQIAEMKPKASYYDLILQNKDVVPITQIAKDYGMSGRKLNALLQKLGVQYRYRKTWFLYQHYAKCGYTQSKTFQVSEKSSVMHTYWTQKGRLFIYELLKKNGVLPVMEWSERDGR